MAELPELCAHRGNAAEFPENTLPALRSALELGVPYLEFDIQLTADAVPVLLHDATLQRTAGRPDAVSDLPWRAVRRIEAAERDRFGDRHAGVTIPSLDQALDLLGHYPGARGVLEIKTESLEAFGVERVMGAVLSRIAPVHERLVVISFEAVAVEATPPDLKTGWVLRRYDRQVRRTAQLLGPDYLFMNRRRLRGSAPLWPGAWRWCIYDVPDPDDALAFHRRGAHLIETTAVANYVHHPAFAARFR